MSSAAPSPIRRRPASPTAHSRMMWKRSSWCGGCSIICPANTRGPPPYRPTPDRADRIEPSLDTLVPANPNKPYDIKELILKMVDEGDFFELSEAFARNIVIGFGLLAG